MGECIMKKKLAKDYAKRIYSERTDKEFDSTVDVFDAHDIEEAFEAGRQSVIDNIPDLKWESYAYSFLAKTPFGTYCIEILNNQWRTKFEDLYLNNGINKSDRKSV